MYIVLIFLFYVVNITCNDVIQVDQQDIFTTTKLCFENNNIHLKIRNIVLHRQYENCTTPISVRGCDNRNNDFRYLFMKIAKALEFNL